MDFDTVITGHSLSMTQGCTSPCAHTPAWALRASHSPSLSTLLVIFASPRCGAGNVSIKISFGHVSISNTLTDTGDRLFWQVGAMPPLRNPSCCSCPAGLQLRGPAGLGLFVRRWGSELTCQQHLAITAEGPQGTEGFV